MCVQRLALAWALMVVGGLASAAPAQAFVTLGPSLSDPGFGGAPCSFDDGCTIGITAAPGGTALAPFDGVIVRWRFKGDGQNTLRALRPAGANGATGAATGPTATGAGCATAVEVATRLPIEAGGIIGSNSFSSAGVCGTSSPVSGAGYRYWNPVLQDGETRNGLSGAREFAEQADVEADADRDVFGDESQDKCVGTPGQFNGCPNVVVIGKVKQKDSKPKVKVSLTVPGQGTLRAGSLNDPALASAAKRLLKPVTQTFTSTTAQQATLTLKLTKSAKRKLADKGKLKVGIKLSFTPTGGPAGSQQVKAKLRV